MKTVFCNIAWMKNYVGVTEDDKPKNGGSYIKENDYGCECYNFRDYNGKCYGFVMINGQYKALEKYFDVSKDEAFVKDVLVVWVATNENKETRVVGWYKNATLYREEQYKNSYINPSDEHNRYYHIEALAKDCFLIPEELRIFPILRASQAGVGMGMGQSNIWYAQSDFAKTILIPKVHEYIENYAGEFANQVITDEMLNEAITDSIIAGDYEKLYEEGYSRIQGEDYLNALKYLNAARRIEETPEIVFCVADALFSMNCFDKAITLYERVIDLDGETEDTIWRLLGAYDYTGNKERTIEYFEKLVLYLKENDTKRGKDNLYWAYEVMAQIYLDLKDKKNALDTIEKIFESFDDEEKIKAAEDMKKTIKIIARQW